VTDTDPQPEPVTNAASWAAAAIAVVGAVLTVLQLAHVITPGDKDALQPALTTAITALVGVASSLLASAHSRKRVTPIARPRDAMGRALVAVQPRPEPLSARLDADFHAWRDGLRHLDDTQEMPRVTEDVQRIPEQVIPGKRLGRHIRHDPRSLAYLVPETTTPTTAIWTRRVPVFDQGEVGSCTGNAAAGVLGTSPFYETLPAGLVDDEGEAVKLYSAATSLDGYPGTYPPDDTGSDGLSVAKACQKAGLISGYQHITSVAAAQTAIKTGPFIVGVNWYSSMDDPNAEGLVTVGGSIRGGHEFECHGYDAQADLWWFTNSWGTSWGKDGTFCMSSASFARLLSEQGDATVFLPIVAPFQPEPPAPAPGPAPATGFPLADVDPWLNHAYNFSHLEGNAKIAIRAWLAGGGS
jgi:hypothetical protein